MVPYQIDTLQKTDWVEVQQIFEAGLATGNATLETDIPSWVAWDEGHLPFGRFVARLGQVIGWAALTAVSHRCVYEGVAEVSVYVAKGYWGQGVGRTLLNELIRSSEQNGIWTLQAHILAENLASISLHHKCGFKTVGKREKLGQRHGVWRDVMLLERRSQTIGT